MVDAAEPLDARAGLAPDSVHLLRTTQQVQYQLSQMADQKASILLGITFVIFTLTLGQARAGQAPLPLLVLGTAAFIAAILSITAVLPSVKRPPSVEEEGNPLFFATFAQLSEQDYVQLMTTIASDPQATCRAFIRDIHQNGRVLARKKYRLLGYAYRVLLAGLICSAAAFAAPYILQTFPA